MAVAIAKLAIFHGHALTVVIPERAAAELTYIGVAWEDEFKEIVPEFQYALDLAN